MGQPLRVLIVDDSSDDAFLTADNLRRAGYDPIWHRVETEQDLTASLSRDTWDVILSDYNLPTFSGMQALRIYKESELDIPFLLVSGSISGVALAEALRAGVDAYVSKDHASELGSVVERQLRAVVNRKQLGQE
jgi:CheY-like chemotaxis protein